MGLVFGIAAASGAAAIKFKKERRDNEVGLIIVRLPYHNRSKWLHRYRCSWNFLPSRMEPRADQAKPGLVIFQASEAASVNFSAPLGSGVFINMMASSP